MRDVGESVVGTRERRCEKRLRSKVNGALGGQNEAVIVPR